MFRVLYALCIVMLIASTAWTAASADSRTAKTQHGLGFVILTALQR
jgi:hypothetical protein